MRKSTRSAPTMNNKVEPFYSPVSSFSGTQIGTMEKWFDIPNRFAFGSLKRSIESFERVANQDQIDIVARKKKMIGQDPLLA